MKRERARQLIAKSFGLQWRDGDKAEELHPIACAMLDYAAQQPGLEWCNYATSNYKESYAAYDSERRGITRQWQDVKAQFMAYYHSDGTEADLLEAMDRAYCGRLQWDANKKEIDYCTGQYWPTEYRQAVAAVFEKAAFIAEYRKSNPEPAR